MKKAAWAILGIAWMIGLTACSSSGEEEAPATATAQPEKAATAAPSSASAAHPQGTVTDVNKVPSGLASPQGSKYSEPAAQSSVKPAPRPVTTEPAKPAAKQTQNSDEPPAPSAAPAAPLAQGEALPPPENTASSGKTTPASSLPTGQAKPFVAQGGAPIASTGGATSPFPGERGYLYGAYPRYRPRTTAQALYVSPYSGYGQNNGQLFSTSIYFQEDSVHLSGQDLAHLQSIADAALTYGKILQITGHASSNNGAKAKAHNAALSLARAQNVASQLQQMGVPAGLIQITALGDAVATNRGQTSGIDRRVDVYIAN